MVCVGDIMAGNLLLNLLDDEICSFLGAKIHLSGNIVPVAVFLKK